MMIQTARAAIGMLAVLACAGAATPAAAQQSAAPAADTTGTASAVDTTLAAPAAPAGERWSLERCIATALHENGDAKAAHARTVQARGAALRAWGGVLPSVTTDLFYNQSRPDKQSGFFGAFYDSSQANVPQYDILLSRRDTYSLEGGVNMSLFNVPAWKEKQRQDRLRESAHHGEAETRNTVAFQVKQQYFALLKATRLAQVSRESEKLALDEQTRSEALFQVGTVARGDVLKARSHRAQTQLDRIHAENQVEIQRSQLKQLIGLPPPTPLQIDEILEEGVTLPDSADAVRRALDSRPGLSQSLAAERAARTGLFGARAQRAPQVTGSLTVDRSRIKDQYDLSRVSDFGASLPGTEDKRYTTQWQGTVRLSVPIFDGLAMEGSMRSAKGALLEAEAARRQQELTVSVEVQTAWLTLREAVQRISVAKEGLASAEEDYKFSKGRYDLGAGTFLDLLTSEVGLSDAKRSYVEALADSRVAEADLERAIGEKRY